VLGDEVTGRVASRETGYEFMCSYGKSKVVCDKICSLRFHSEMRLSYSGEETRAIRAHPAYFTLVITRGFLLGKDRRVNHDHSRSARL
jgi:hypothetical protein